MRGFSGAANQIVIASARSMVGRFELLTLLLRSHPERSRASGGAKDLARTGSAFAHARSLGPLVRARAFGMTPAEKGERAERVERNLQFLSPS